MASTSASSTPSSTAKSYKEDLLCLKKMTEMTSFTEEEWGLFAAALGRLHNVSDDYTDVRCLEYAYIFCDHNKQYLISGLKYDTDCLVGIETQILTAYRETDVTKLVGIESTLQSLLIYYGNVRGATWLEKRLYDMSVCLYLAQLSTVERHDLPRVYDKLESLLGCMIPSLITAWAWVVVSARYYKMMSRRSIKKCDATFLEASDAFGHLSSKVALFYRLLAMHYRSIFRQHVLEEVSPKAKEMLKDAVLDTLLEVDASHHKKSISQTFFYVWLRETIAHIVFNTLNGDLIKESDHDLSESACVKISYGCLVAVVRHERGRLEK